MKGSSPRAVFYVLLILIIGLCLLLLHYGPAKHKSVGESAPVGNVSQETNSGAALAATNSTINGESANSRPTSGVLPTSAQPNVVDHDKALLAQWQAPIDFYGKVVDENTNPVVGADIQFVWTEKPGENGEKRSGTQSDANGLFELHGAVGEGLDVAVSKQGYYASRRDKWSFGYAINEHYSPDSFNPAVFHLRKKNSADPLIHIGGIGLHTMRDYLLAADGKPTDVSLLNGHLAQPGQGDLEVSFQAGPPLVGFPSRMTWQCQVTVPGGGLIATDEEFPFLAPENNYQTFDTWSVTPTNWTEEVDRQYYVKLKNGDFGRVVLKVIGASKTYFRMESFLNPSGTRNLEFDPNNVVQPVP